MPITVVLLGTQPRRSDEAETKPPRLVFDAPRVVVGRGESCEVRLPDRTVSHRHLTLRQRGADWLIIDEGSTNGTVVARVGLAAQSPRVVEDGDLVRVGRQFLELYVTADVPTKPQATKEAALALVEEALLAEGEDGRPRVAVVEGVDAGKDLRVPPDRRVVLGRARDADLHLEDADASRRHVEIGRRGDAVVVRDLGSRTGTALDDRDVGTTDVVWKPGQRLTLAGSVLSLEFVALEELADLERAPDEKVPVGSLPWPDALPVVEAPPDVSGEEASPDEGDPEEGDAEEGPGGLPANRKLAKAPARSGWSATDFAVVLLALGVLALSAVGYLVLLKR